MNIFNKSIQLNVYTAIAVLYTIRRYIPLSTVMSRSIFVLFFLLSLYYLIRTFAEYSKYPLVNILLFLVVLFSMYGFFLVLSPPDSSWLRTCSSYQFLNDFMESLLPIFAFIYFSKKKLISSKWITQFFLVFAVAAIVKYSGMQTETLEAVVSGEENVQRNASYTILALIPCIPFFKGNNVLKYILWMLILMVVIFSVKRGAILLSVIAFLAYVWLEIREKKKNSKLLIIVLSAVALIFLNIFIQNLLSNYDLLNYRLNATLEGDTSGRDSIYLNYAKYYLSESNFFELLFGHGAYGTLHYLGLMAHNDWLELTIDMGLLGLVVYAIYWTRILKMVAKSKNKCSEDVYMSLLLFTILFLGKSLFSMSIMSIPIFASVPFGYCIVQYYNAYKK